MDVETKPLWTTTREAMGHTWSVNLYPNDVVLGSAGALGSESAGSVLLRNQHIAILAAGTPAYKDETLLHELLEMAVVKAEISMDHRDIERLSGLLFAFLRGFGLWCDFPWPDREGT